MYMNKKNDNYITLIELDNTNHLGLNFLSSILLFKLP